MTVPLVSITARRKAANGLFWAGCFGALAMVIIPTLWMLIGVVSRAVPVF